MMLSASIPLLAQGATQQNPTGQLLQMLGTMAFLVVVMYVLMIRPQQKKAKAHAELLKTLRAGDKILTTGGFVGIVISVKEKTVTLRSADSKLEVLKSGVTEVTERGAERSSSSPEA